MVMSNQTLWVTFGPFLASICSPLPSSTITRIKVAAHPIAFIMGCFRSVCKTEKARVEKLLPPREEADDFDQWEEALLSCASQSGRLICEQVCYWSTYPALLRSVI